MLPDPGTRNEMGRYLQIAQVGFEMVVPVGLGMAADNYLGWSPWGILGGAALGLTVGLVHLVHLANRQDDLPDSGGPPGSGPGNRPSSEEPRTP